MNEKVRRSLFGGCLVIGGTVIVLYEWTLGTYRMKIAVNLRPRDTIVLKTQKISSYGVFLAYAKYNHRETI